jgi:hypothetical protein
MYRSVSASFARCCVSATTPPPSVIRVPAPKTSAPPPSRRLLFAAPAEHEVILKLAEVVLRGQHDPPGIQAVLWYDSSATHALAPQGKEQTREKDNRCIGGDGDQPLGCCLQGTPYRQLRLSWWCWSYSSQAHPPLLAGRRTAKRREPRMARRPGLWPEAEKALSQA